ncbi:mechanosensitive ion channel protein MscS [Sphingomonas oligophenolica]|uniref:Mechanosensitive ion channel protein MscS n=2 Tax=Sphingomonas oligophenolica TaxID=301154 RepID=A0A502CK37_9SPHN|nr:mechanosensitive ion channel protein MscS [Sphingomonas oligophenolica]
MIELAIAGGLVLLALAIGVFAGRKIGPRFTDLWATHVASHGEGLGPRMTQIVRHGVAAILLAIIVNAYPWPPIAGAPIGLALGVAAALFAQQVLRGLGIARWMAWIIAAIIFVALFSRSVGGLDAITNTLDMVGFNVGKRRLSLLWLVTILITGVALIAVVRLANRVVSHSITRSKAFDPTQKLLAQKLASIAVIIAAFFIGIDMLNIDLTAFAVFGGALGLAVGFGLQKTVGNLIAGIILLMDRSIKPGDVIVVGDSFGWVNKIGVRAVSVVTRDGKEHLIPNENLMTQEVENWSYSDRNVRVRIPVGVSYDCDLKLAQELMLKAASDSPRVLDTPKPNVWLSGFGDSSVDHEILAWITDPESGVGNVRSDVLNRLWWMFKEHGIEIPFPQRDVHIRSSVTPSDQ